MFVTLSLEVSYLCKTCWFTFFLNVKGGVQKKWKIFIMPFEKIKHEVKPPFLPPIDFVQSRREDRYMLVIQWIKAWKSYMLQQVKPSSAQEHSLQSLTHSEPKPCCFPSLSTHPKEEKPQELLTLVNLWQRLIVCECVSTGCGLVKFCVK